MLGKTILMFGLFMLGLFAAFENNWVHPHDMSYFPGRTILKYWRIDNSSAMAQEINPGRTVTPPKNSLPPTSINNNHAFLNIPTSPPISINNAGNNPTNAPTKAPKNGTVKSDVIYRSVNFTMYKCVAQTSEAETYDYTYIDQLIPQEYGCRSVFAQSAGRLMNGRTVVLIGGPHFGGTSILNLLLGNVKGFSILKNTGKPEDEGQHLQRYYLPDFFIGGVCKYACNEKSKLTEKDFKPGQEGIFGPWSKFWNMDAKVLVEKSPPDIMKSRWFQSIFDYARINGHFIFLIRHPFTIAENRCWGSRNKYFNNWFSMMETLSKDIQKLKNAYVIRYEEWMSSESHARKVINRLVDLITRRKKDDQDMRKQLRRQLDFEGNRSDVKIIIKPVVWKEETEHERFKLYDKFENRLRLYGYSLNSTGFTPTLPDSLKRCLISM